MSVWRILARFLLSVIGMRSTNNRAGFTLVEIMIVVAIIGLLSVIAIPSITKARETSLGVRIANDLRVFGNAFAFYALENGGYPPDSHEVLPAGLEGYIDKDKFQATTPIGGHYNWEGPDYYPYAGVAISGADAPRSFWAKVDAAVDDDNLRTGHFRFTSNGRYTYIIE